MTFKEQKELTDDVLNLIDQYAVRSSVKIGEIAKIFGVVIAYALAPERGDIISPEDIESAVDDFSTGVESLNIAETLPSDVYDAICKIVEGGAI